MFLPIALDGILPSCLSQQYDVAPFASQVSDKHSLPLVITTVSLFGCVVIVGFVPKISKHVKRFKFTYAFVNSFT